MPAIQNPALTLKAKLFRGLADTSRLALLDALRSGEKMVSELVSLTGLSQPNVSGHLNCLKDCGLLIGRQEGRCVFYSFADPQMEALIDAADKILSRVNEQIACCSNYECKTARKCLSDKQCASSVRVSSPALSQSAITIPLVEGQS